MRFVVWYSLLFSLIGGYKGVSQNLPIYNSYYANPFLYNPATAATNYLYVYAHHRQQWVGIEGAPMLSSITLTTLINESRTGLGFKASSYKRGLLNTTDFTLAYAYCVPVNKTNTLYFGLSGGAVSNTVDIANASDPSDPALLNAQTNNMQPAGSFGVLYQTKLGINIGIALPQLFNNTFINTSFSDLSSISPTDHGVVSLGYQKKVAGKIVTKKVMGMKKRVKSKETYAPLELYALYRYSSIGTSQFEVISKLNIVHRFWVGGSYRQSYGFTANAGINTGLFSIGYSFELGGQPESGFSQGTHEIFLGLKLGHEKKIKNAVPLLRSTLQTTTGPQHHARFQAENPELLQETVPSHSKKKHYVVVRSFTEFPAADAYKAKLQKEKYNANVLYYEKEKSYCVYVFSSDKSGDAHEEARNLKKYTKLKDTRVIDVDEKGN